jgi:hypothetical protein
MRRWSAIGGIVFVVLAFVSRAVRGSVPDTSKSNAVSKFVNFYADKSHNNHALVAVVLGVIGLFFFAWFLGGLWSAVRQAEGGVTAPTIIVAVGGAGFLALGLLTHLVDNVQGITLHFDKGYRAEHLFNPGTAMLLSDLGTGVFLASMVAVGAATAAAGIVIQRTRVFPAWLAWLGFAIAVLALPVIPPLSFVAALLLALWTLVISVLLFTSAEPRAT